ncbi:MAG: hypothetical protein AAFZ52_16670 [Bacteroidota bacterium]
MPYRYLLLLFLPLTGLAQTDLRTDQEFFRAELPAYQEWLDRTGPGAVLRVKDLTVRSRKLTLLLETKPEDETAAVSALNELRADFDSLNAVRLEERLFLKLLTTMEVAADRAEILLLNKPAAGKFPSLRLRIFHDGEQIVAEGNFRNEVPHQVTLPPFRLDTTFRHRLATDADLAADPEVHFRINRGLLDSLRAYFVPRLPEGFPPRLVSESPGVMLIRNVKAEVVEPGFLTFLDPHESLDFTVDHRFTPEGIELHLIVDGKIGSGLRPPRSSRGFRDMDPEYQTELETYVRTFTLERLQPWLLAILRTLN